MNKATRAAIEKMPVVWSAAVQIAASGGAD